MGRGESGAEVGLGKVGTNVEMKNGEHSGTGSGNDNWEMRVGNIHETLTWVIP